MKHSGNFDLAAFITGIMKHIELPPSPTTYTPLPGTPQHIYPTIFSCRPIPHVPFRKMTLLTNNATDYDILMYDIVSILHVAHIHEPIFQNILPT